MRGGEGKLSQELNKKFLFCFFAPGTGKGVAEKGGEEAL
jgi:hypothetical protein